MTNKRTIKINFAGYEITANPRGEPTTEIRRDYIDVTAPGDYGCDPIMPMCPRCGERAMVTFGVSAEYFECDACDRAFVGAVRFRMIPSGDVVDADEKERRLKR